MKRIFMIAGVSLALTGCDGDIIKSIARAILADEQPQQQAQVAQQPQAVQPVIVQDPNAQVQAQQPVEVVQQPQVAAPVQAAPKQKTTATPAPARKAAQPAYSETPVNLPATVITRHGSNVMVRRSPSRSAGKVGYLYTTEQIYVIAETNKCETINGIYNCWVKVQDATGLTGYSFGGYLNY
ncbi:SH3 domain-containing protein [Moraxella sp. FZLJ2107]|uniref:SH3 domain-containing protein n=1 Tax=unclassified Moraxella TaxID=2685852 RepID=UPI00209BE2F9|nr:MULTISPECIES: SH3 domain-containing protein [unclassified Moraxella]USZ14507.1 SH3 domain-containing protein [Moraxella sp. FZFQ2102]UTO05180.1 SH3 domain-containing protein [Moraxella sp. FZLJ2107]UTO21915.1 SH3 domain-containing protein [Moraxella sp. FZLJ2109]